MGTPSVVESRVGLNNIGADPRAARGIPGVTAVRNYTFKGAIGGNAVIVAA